MDSDFYIINPDAFMELKKREKQLKTEFVSIYISAPYEIAKERAKGRGDYEKWKENYESESQEFSQFEQSGTADYVVLNTGTLDDAVNDFIEIVNQSKN